MNSEKKESYMKAGQVHQEACKIAEDSVQVGVNKSNLVNHVEEYITERAGLAFPVNVCVNNEVAHKSPSEDNDESFSENDLVSVDIGVHVDGYVADGAFSVDLSGNYSDLIKANDRALNSALDTISAGVDVDRVGSVIEEELQDSGYNPIRNLFGHGVAQYEAHTEPKVPNSEGINSQTLESGDVIAVEPFATTQVDKVGRTSDVTIFEFEESKSVRNSRARKILSEVKEKHSHFPFSPRHIQNYNDIGMKMLVRNSVVKPHPLLSVDNGVVSQSEHTVIVRDGGCELITGHLHR